MNSFLITASGRSGTKFLSDQLNKSKKWSVIHEYQNDFLYEKLVNRVRARFLQENYGEVNSYLRQIAKDIDTVNKLGVIIRNPVDIFLSTYNRKPTISIDKIISHLNNETFLPLHNLICNHNVKIIRFDLMTSDINYLIEIARYFGIDDLDVTMLSLDKINHTSKFNHTPSNNNIEKFIDTCKWYIDKYKKYYYKDYG